jgi:anti-sigma regulatory factor (Ser/Thr protein kinase)
MIERTGMDAGGEPSDAVASVSVPHERTGVRMARHALSGRLESSGVAGDDVADAMLVVSELVSNSIRHAEPLPSGEITVRWRVSPEVLHLEIVDGGAGTRPRAGVAALSATGGRGLDIVRQVSTAWGVTAAGESVTVWADVPRRGARVSPGARGDARPAD